ncbi:MAG: lysophospholipid acyltransferase family protein [bacterium]
MLIALVRGISGLFSALPLNAARAVGRRLGWIYGYVIRYHRRDATEALRRSLPETTEAERRQILKRMYLNLGMNLVEELRMGRMTDEELYDYVVWDGEAHIREVLKEGKGVIVLTAHMGNWCYLFSSPLRYNVHATIITKKIRNNTVNRYWTESRKRPWLNFVPAHHSYRQCLASLRKNELVGFILDQNMTREEGLFVDFFGKPACTSPGLAFMSAQSGAAVVPMFLLRQPNGRHLGKIFPPIPPPPDRKPETILAYTQLYTKVIEDRVRQVPDQWIWIHRRWRTQPAAPKQT